MAVNDQEAWLDKHTINCTTYGARLTPEACQRYAAENPDRCANCARKTQKGCAIPKVCSVDGCGKDHYAKGLCQQHYARKRYAASGMSAKRPRRICSVDGCQAQHSAKGYCKQHYQQLIVHPKQAQASRRLKLDFSGADRALFERLEKAARANGNSLEGEVKIYIEACLDYYEAQGGFPDVG